MAGRLVVLKVPIHDDIASKSNDRQTDSRGSRTAPPERRINWQISIVNFLINGAIQPQGPLMASLFSPLQIRDVVVRNRIGVSPMCQYSCAAGDGMATDWHVVHLGARASGGAGLVFAEATAVTAEGRISPGDLGLWHDGQIAPLARITAFVESQGAVPGIQLAHAGRKASTPVGWEPGLSVPESDGGWVPVAPSAVPFGEGHLLPSEMSPDEVAAVPGQFAAAARRALAAGFRFIELHAAHGYLMHSFLSPVANKRADEWGGSFENRIRLVVDVARAVRGEIGESIPLAVRLSATDWLEGGWTLEDSVALSRELRTAGVDVIDCSSGAIVPDEDIPVGSGFQVPFAETVRREAGIATAAVGYISDAKHADALVRNERADLVLIGREMLRNPSWPLHAALSLGAPAPVPSQYLPAFRFAPAASVGGPMAPADGDLYADSRPQR
jgi:2,4-dienoyl-CoA reductase-like NADH-dependent reductase (Old Yellow Enzyme family)